MNNIIDQENDNASMSRLDELIAVTIEDYVVRAEKDVEDGEEPVEAEPALKELASAALADIMEHTEYQTAQQVFEILERLLDDIRNRALEILIRPLSSQDSVLPQ